MIGAVRCRLRLDVVFVQTELMDVERRKIWFYYVVIKCYQV